MLSKKSFVITIGDAGAVVALHDGSAIKNKVFLEELTEEQKVELKNLFTQNDSAPISVLLDTIDQTYKKKVYPAVAAMNLKHIAKRDMDSDGDRESFKNYIILDPKKSFEVKKSECLFVSLSSSESINKWIDFLAEMPNHLIGIYALPVESTNLFNLLKNDIKSASETQGTKKQYLYCLIIQNKVSGFRQLVFSEQGLVFTRMVNYDFTESDWIEKYEQDIYSTFEYLKRLFHDILIKELPVVNILSEDLLKKIKETTNNVELNFVNYTPSQAAARAGYENILQDNSNFCDLLISKIFSNKKSILRFTIPRMIVLEKLYTGLKISYYTNILLILLISVVAVFITLASEQAKSDVETAEAKKTAATEELRAAKAAALGDPANQLAEEKDSISIDRIMDFGKIDELLSTAGRDVIDIYTQLKFLRDFDVTLNKFTYSIDNFDSKSPQKNSVYKIVFTGDLNNKSGDIDDLFKSFDTVSSAAKKAFDKHDVKYSEMPRNIDFTKKFYNFPIDFTVTKK